MDVRGVSKICAGSLAFAVLRKDGSVVTWGHAELPEPRIWTGFKAVLGQGLGVEGLEDDWRKLVEVHGRAGGHAVKDFQLGYSYRSDNHIMMYSVQ